MNGLSASGLVFAGAGLGAVCRYWIGNALADRSFPWGTLGVNILGGFAIGLLAVLLPDHAEVKAFWIVGVLGGFTTFSTLSAEMLAMIQSRAYSAALGYVLASNVGAIGACALGWWLAARLSQ